MKYGVDPVYLKPGEGRLFLDHLSQQILHVDVWDGDSLLLIGTCTVDLQVGGYLIDYHHFIAPFYVVMLTLQSNTCGEGKKIDMSTNDKCSQISAS